MTEKWKELLKAPQGQRKVFILLAVLGIALVLLSGNGTAGSKSKSETTTARDYDAYVANLEGRLQKTVASMDGVGTCKVMITLERVRHEQRKQARCRQWQQQGGLCAL